MKTRNVRSLVQNYDFVINALPGFIGFQTLEAIIEAKKNVVDIAFFAEDPFLLNELAKKQNVVALVDCGVSPGMSNILAGYVNNLLVFIKKPVSPHLSLSESKRNVLSLC
ncbi:saccharopine dehydrogenase NADP-binding domain-containing protein [candidate division KSB1 bacterium]|nr:saccharopine dehydrogenase NADP-binding domain-containing protein [candidate division KSB1 bacterium]